MGAAAVLGQSHCAHGSAQGPETGVWDGHSAGVRFIYLPGPLRLQCSLQAPASPLMVCLGAPLLVFASLHHTLFSFIPFCQSVHPSMPWFPSLPLYMGFWWTNWQWHRRSVWRQGLSIAETRLGFFTLACMLSHDAKGTQMIYTQCIFLFTAGSFCHGPRYCLLITFSLLLWWSSLTLVSRQ